MGKGVIDKKRHKEKVLVSHMIGIYCKGHHSKVGLCDECLQLEQYAHKRIDLCPFMETKTFCSKCQVHCYQRDMRLKIKEVMRYSGPRLLFSHPFLLIKHMWLEKMD